MGNRRGRRATSAYRWGRNRFIRSALALGSVLIWGAAVQIDGALAATSPAVSVSALNLTRGQAFSGPVATFQDPALKGGSCGPVTDYAVTVAWGDGAQDAPTPALVSGPDQSELCTYQVPDSHTYGQEGEFKLAVTVTGPSSATPGTGSAQVTVTAAALTASCSPQQVAAGSPLNATVASFSDADPGRPASDYSAGIDWGDGSTGNGTVTAQGASFTIGGSHTFSAVGSFQVGVTITSNDGATASASCTTTVTEGPYLGETTDPGVLSAASLFADGPGGGSVQVAMTALLHNRAPRASLKVPSTIIAGRVVVLSAAGSRDPDGRVAGYRWDLNGDGVYDDGFGPSVSFAFSHPGRARVSLEVIDNKGRITPLTRTLVVRGAGAPTVLSLLRGATVAKRLNGAFTAGLADWLRNGSGFASPVRRQAWVPASQQLDTAGRLGGDYANRLHVSAGNQGHRWVTSLRPDRGLRGLSPDAAANLATGLLVSHPFVLRARYIDYLLGGGGGASPGSERVEIWARADKRYRPIPSLTRAAGAQDTMISVQLDARKLRGQDVAIAVIDGSSTAHIDFGNPRTSPSPTRISDLTGYYRLPPGGVHQYTPPPPIWGFADYHAHPFANLGFGGLQGIHTYMGVPGGDVSLYDHDPTAFEHDVYFDDDYHFGGPLGAFVVNASEGRRHADTDTAALIASVLSSGAATHPTLGGRCVGGDGFGHDVQRNPIPGHGCLEFHGPGEIGPAHEQMNVFEIHRAWEGGLRLMSSLAVSSQALEDTMGFVHAARGSDGILQDLFGAPTEFDGGRSVGEINLTSDASVLQANVEAMRELAALNSSWMAIAYDPQQAYDIASHGKLAIVLGTELDTNGALLAAPVGESAQARAAAEVNWLWHLGIRQVTPIHCCDNQLGGAALFQDGHNTANDLINRPVKDVTAIRVDDDIHDQGTGLSPKPGFTGTPQVGYFMHEEPGCPDQLDRGECIWWKFDEPGTIGPNEPAVGLATDPVGQQGILDIDGQIVPRIPHAGVREENVYGESSAYHTIGGRNPRGLTDYGRAYITAMMNRGMLIDMEHMSEQTIDDLTDPGTQPGHQRGPVWNFSVNACDVRTSYYDNTPGGCWDSAYPLMSSHTTLRAQALQPGQTTNKGFLSREFDRSAAQIEYIRRSGGVVGPVVAHDPVNSITTGGIAHWNGRGAFPWVPVHDHDWAITSNVANDCAGSSKSWIQAYLYSLEKMGGQGVGLGTDMALFGGPGPRFGATHPPAPYACDDSREAHNTASVEGSAMSRATGATADAAREEHADPAQYNRAAQTNPITYVSPTAVRLGVRGLRLEQDPAGVTRNFNTQGMLTYGTLPDLIQDAADVGVTPHDLTPLFQSAQAYVDMWSKAFFLAGCYGSDYSRCSDNDAPEHLNAGAVCANACPDDPGRGLALTPSGQAFGFVRPDS